MIWAVLGIILIVCVINVANYNLNSNKFQAVNSTAYYISQNVNIAASRNVQVHIKLPEKIAGTTTASALTEKMLRLIWEV